MLFRYSIMYTLNVLLDFEETPLYEPRKCNDLQCLDKPYAVLLLEIQKTQMRYTIYGPEFGASNMSPHSPTSAPRLLRVLRLSAHPHGRRENESDQFSDAASQARQCGCPWH